MSDGPQALDQYSINYGENKARQEIAAWFESLADKVDSPGGVGVATLYRMMALQIRAGAYPRDKG